MHLVTLLRLQQIACCPVLVTLLDPKSVKAEAEDIKQGFDAPDRKVSPAKLEKGKRMDVSGNSVLSLDAQY